MLTDIYESGFDLHLRGVRYVTTHTDGDMVVSIPLEDALYLLDWMTERKAYLQEQVRQIVQIPGAKTRYIVKLYSEPLSFEPDAWLEIETDNALDAVKRAMQQRKTTVMDKVIVISEERFVNFRKVQMQGDTLDFAYCRTEKRK